MISYAAYAERVYAMLTLRLYAMLPLIAIIDIAIFSFTSIFYFAAFAFILPLRCRRFPPAISPLPLAFLPLLCCLSFRHYAGLVLLYSLFRCRCIDTIIIYGHFIYA